MTTRILAAEARSVPALSQNHIEMRLLVIASLFLASNTLALSVVTGQNAHWLHWIVWSVCAFGGHVVLRRKRETRDPVLFPAALFLSGWGILMIDRLAPMFADRQVIWLMVGAAAMLAVVQTRPILELLRRYRYLMLITGLSLLLATILLGVNPSGQPGAPRLWLNIGEFFFQPSEFLKVILVVFLASYMAEQYPSLHMLRSHSGQRTPLFSSRVLGPVILMFAASVIILLWQRDLGTATLFFIVFLLMLYLSTGSFSLLVGGGLLIMLVGLLAYNILAVVQLRIDIWLNPWLDPNGRAFQIVQSLFAFSAGGILGSGIGQGLPTAIPVVHSDFVFAALAEEWGLIGVIALCGILMTVAARGLRIAARHSARPFYSLLAAGLTLLIIVQSLMIMGGVLKLIPLTGVTLPFLSYGGSSLLVNFLMVGLLLRLSAEPTVSGA